MRCPPSELLHLNQSGGAGLDRMVSLKGGLRRVVIQQLRLLGIVGFPIPRYDLQNGTLQMQKQTASELSFCIQRVVIQMRETCCYCAISSINSFPF